MTEPGRPQYEKKTLAEAKSPINPENLSSLIMTILPTNFLLFDIKDRENAPLLAISHS